MQSIQMSTYITHTMMKKTTIFTSLILACSLPVWGQGALDALPLMENHMKGTARYTALAGAFGALGGDISTIRQNPAGLGIYRSSEVTLTAGLNFYNNSTSSNTRTSTNNDFYFSGDNLGFVGTILFRDNALRTLNFGFSYINVANFDNQYRADWTNIGSSLTQLIASQTSKSDFLPSQLSYPEAGSNYNPYEHCPWLSVLAYNGFIINPVNGDTPKYEAIYQPNNHTTGNAYLYNRTKGSIDEYDINISGNVSDMLYWGITLGLTDIDYRLESHYGEQLQNAILYEGNDLNDLTPTPVAADYDLVNTLKTTGYGFGLKLGLIFRPVQFLRIGFAYHSPTYYQMTDTYWGGLDYNVGDHSGTASDDNYTDVGITKYNCQTPWRIIGSIAAVIGKLALISVDYEYSNAKNMHYGSNNGYTDYTITNENIQSHMQGMSTVRVGGEIRVMPAMSLRAGYAYENTAVNGSILNGEIQPQIVEGTLTNYILPHDMHNITCGIGYRINNISLDAAYVHSMQKYDIFPFTPYDANVLQAQMNMHRNMVKLTLGYRF